jgi:hypothetical protein
MMVMVEFQCNLVKSLLVGVYQFWVEVFQLVEGEAFLA